MGWMKGVTADQDPGPATVPRGEEAGWSGEGGRDTAQMQLDPDMTAAGARWGRLGRAGCQDQSAEGAQGTQ